MKCLTNVLMLMFIIMTSVSCDYYYELDLVNNYESGIYIWSTQTGLHTGDDPASLDELNDKWYLVYADAGGMGSFAFLLGGKMTAQQFVDEVFERADNELFVAIFDAGTLDNNWGIGKMSDYVIQKYWLTKEDVIEEDGLTYKTISFPPNEGMKNVKMEPAYGTYPIK